MAVNPLDELTEFVEGGGWKQEHESTSLYSPFVRLD
jgi:hypothetical protein